MCCMHIILHMCDYICWETSKSGISGKGHEFALFGLDISKLPISKEDVPV